MAGENQDFPDNLLEMAADAAFTFACGPEQPCFNRCCSQLHLPLTPYDAMRLARNLNLSCEEILTLFTMRDTDAATGFPAFTLRMIESPDAPCPFVTPAGCSVYEDRPGACRSYPLGRGAKLDHAGIQERFFMIREEHCAGFGCGMPLTPGQWFVNQEMEPYNLYNDRYMRLLSLIRASGRPIGPRLAPMALLALWQPDRFLEFLHKMNILTQVHWSGDTAALSPGHPKAMETALDFGFDWLELVVFGQAENMRRISPAQN